MDEAGGKGGGERSVYFLSLPGRSLSAAGRGMRNRRRSRRSIWEELERARCRVAVEEAGSGRGDRNGLRLFRFRQVHDGYERGELVGASHATALYGRVYGRYKKKETRSGQSPRTVFPSLT